MKKSKNPFLVFVLAAMVLVGQAMPVLAAEQEQAAASKTDHVQLDSIGIAHGSVRNSGGMSADNLSTRTSVKWQKQFAGHGRLGQSSDQTIYLQDRSYNATTNTYTTKLDNIALDGSVNWSLDGVDTPIYQKDGSVLSLKPIDASSATLTTSLEKARKVVLSKVNVSSIHTSKQKPAAHLQEATDKLARPASANVSVYDSVYGIDATSEEVSKISPDGQVQWSVVVAGTSYNQLQAGADGTVYVGTNTYGQDLVGHLYAIKDGVVTWSQDTAAAFQSLQVAPNGNLYVEYMDSDSWVNLLYALKPDGSMLWNYVYESAFYSYPAVATDSSVYIDAYSDAGETLMVLDPNDGTAKSLLSPQDYFQALVPGVNGTFYAIDINYTTHKHNLYAFDNGTATWKKDIGTYNDLLVGSDGTLVLYSWDYPHKRVNLEGLKVDGSKIFETSRTQNASVYDGNLTIGQDGNLYQTDYNSSTHTGHLAALSLTGHDLGSVDIQHAMITSLLAPASGTVYLSTDDNKLYAMVEQNHVPTVPLVHTFKDTDTNLTGITEPYNVVTVKKGSSNGTVLNTAKADSEGNFSVAIGNQYGGTPLSVTSTNWENNTSAAFNFNVSDTLPPAPPTVNKIHDGTYTVVGTTEPNATIKVEVPGDSTKYSTKANASGAFSIRVSKKLVLGTQVTVTAYDAAQHISFPTVATVVESVPPAKPAVDPVGDNQTAVTGSTEANATVTVTTRVSNKLTVLGTVQAGEDGSFSVTIPSQKAGTSLSITATDENDNVSQAVTVTVLDKTAPNAPSVNKVKEKATTLTGKAEPHAKITVKINNISFTATAGSTGTFSVSFGRTYKPVLGDLLTVTAQDSAGNVSAETTVTVADGIPPVAPTLNAVHVGDTKITGQAEPHATLTVTARGKVIGQATQAGDDGSFQVTIPAQLYGTALYVTATDADGNVSASAHVTVLSNPTRR